VDSNAAGQPTESGWYEIRLRGSLGQRWSAWLDGMDISHDPAGITVLRGRVVDQAALHGVLARLRDIGLPLISVTPVEPTETQPITRPDPSGA